MNQFFHQPVLLRETIEELVTKKDGIYVDCTLGGGGHTEAILSASPDTRVIGIDQDTEALKASAERLAPYGDRAVFVWNNFRNIDAVLSELGIEKVDGFLFDLGISSPQLDHADRGFSYQQDAPLDMRMNRESTGLTARDIVNTYTEEELAEILWKYGEERWAKRIAAFIVESREKKPLETTGELVSVIKAAIPKKVRQESHHPAKKSFQALRIAVNDELNIITASYAKRIGTKKSIALLKTNPNYIQFAANMDIDVTISTTEATVDAIMKFLRGDGIKTLHSTFNGELEVYEYVLDDKFSKLGETLANVDLRGKCIIAGVKRSKSESFVPNGTYQFEVGDTILVACSHSNYDAVMEFFK